MKKHAWIRYTPIALAAALSLTACGGDDVTQQGLSAVKNVVVIYAENRSFDNLYGNFPARTACRTQRPRTRCKRIATARRWRRCRRSGAA